MDTPLIWSYDYASNVVFDTLCNASKSCHVQTHWWLFCIVELKHWYLFCVVKLKHTILHINAKCRISTFCIDVSAKYRNFLYLALRSTQNVEIPTFLLFAFCNLAFTASSHIQWEWKNLLTSRESPDQGTGMLFKYNIRALSLHCTSFLIT